MALQLLTSCPLCGGKNFKEFLKVKDYSITGETFTIEECHTCSLKFTNPRPDEMNIGKYYQSENYVSHSDTKKGLVNKLYHSVRNITIKKKLQLINNLSTQSRILDIGCGTGYFLKACKEDGWKILGTEPDINARKIAQAQLEQDLYSSIFQIDAKQNFEIITLWHVLEHVHQLKETLYKINVLLRTKGKLIIAVPNPDSLDAQLYKDKWAAYDVPRHLYHFNQKSMEILLNSAGFRIIKTKPMIFDSFYISMMSEQYKSEKKNINYIKSFINGFKSNIYGLFSNKNYSSIIYIAEKITE